MKPGWCLLLCALVLYGCVPLARCGQNEGDLKVAEFWEQRQKSLEALEAKHKQPWGAFDAPPRFVFSGTDAMDRTAAFYAPLQDCKYLPEFHSIFTDGSDGRYFRYTMSFGMKDIIRFHGHSCEHLYYTAAICRLICDKLFGEGVVDRSLLRGVCGSAPCGVDSLCYITGGRLHYGTLRIEPKMGHAVLVQRIDTGETWIGAYKDGVNSWNPVTVFGRPNNENPAPHKRWSGWEGEPDTPEDQLAHCKIKWRYERPEVLQRLRDLKDNLKVRAEGEKPQVDPHEVRDEFTWLQNAHLKQVFSHPLEESFQIKRVSNFRWEYPHVEPMWVPRMDQRAKWSPCPPRPASSAR